MNSTTWSPDTCDCVITYDWDSNSKESERTHTNYRFIKKCKEHEVQKHDIIIEENVMKNNAIEEIRSYMSVNNNEEVVESWSFEGKAPNRKLKLKIVPDKLALMVAHSQITTTDHKNKNNNPTLKQKLDSKFGVGRVTLI